MALQAVEVLVAGVGHYNAHDGDADVCQESVLAPGCDTDYQPALLDWVESSPERLPASPHDDCAVCRHFSQPVVSVALTLEIAGSDLIEPHVLPVTPAVVAV